MGDSEDEFRQLRGGAVPSGPDPGGGEPEGEEAERRRRRRLLPGGRRRGCRGEAAAAPGCAARDKGAAPSPAASPPGSRPDAAAQGPGGGGLGEQQQQEAPSPRRQVPREDVHRGVPGGAEEPRVAPARQTLSVRLPRRCPGDDACERTPRPAVPGCPLCGRAFATLRSRANHLKRCAAHLQVPAPLLLQAVRHQAAEAPPESGLEDAAAPAVSRAKRKGSSFPAERLAKKRRRGVKVSEADEELLVAVAMSRSLLEEEKARAKRLQLLQGRQGKRPPRAERTKPAASAPPLLLQDPEKARQRTEERVALLLSEVEEFPPTPPLPVSCLMQAELSRKTAGPQALPSRPSLWEFSSLTGQCDPESFGSAGISIPVLELKSEQAPTRSSAVAHWGLIGQAEVEPGSLEAAPLPSTVPVGSLGGSAGRQPCSQQDTKALQDLLELAGEGLTLTQWNLDAQQQERLGAEQEPAEILQNSSAHSLEKGLRSHILDRSSLLGGLAEAFKGMVNNPHLSDVQFQVDSGDVFFAHTFVLYARCPQLMEAVKHSAFLVAEEGSDETWRVLLKDVTGEATLALLNYLYAADCCVPPHVLPDVAALASRFGVKELVALCGGQAGLAKKEGGDGCSRAETFEDLLKSMWMGEEEEVLPKQREEEEEEEENVDEKDLEEIYEFAATQHKVIQGKAEERGNSSGKELEEEARWAALQGSCPKKVPEEPSTAVADAGSPEMLVCESGQGVCEHSGRGTQTEAPLEPAEFSQGTHRSGQQTVDTTGKECVIGKSPLDIFQGAEREPQLAGKKPPSEDLEDSLIVVLDSDEEQQLGGREELGLSSGQPSWLPRVKLSPSPITCTSQRCPLSPETVGGEHPPLGKPLLSQHTSQQLLRINSDEEERQAKVSHQVEMLVPETPLPCCRDPPDFLTERAGQADRQQSEPGAGQQIHISATESSPGMWPLVGRLPLSSSPWLEPLLPGHPPKPMRSSSSPGLPRVDVVVVSDSEEEQLEEVPWLRNLRVPRKDVKDAPGEPGAMPQDPREEDGSPSLKSPIAGKMAVRCLEEADSLGHQLEELLDVASEDSDDSEILCLSQRLPSVEPAQKTPDLVCPAKETPTPLTPMPHYSIMETPNLKKELSRFGVRALPKRQMVLKLKEIFQYTHQRSSSPVRRRPELVAATSGLQNQPSKQREEVQRSQSGERCGGLSRDGDQRWQQLMEPGVSQPESVRQKTGTLFPPGGPGGGGSSDDPGLGASQESTGSSAAGSDASAESLSSLTEFESSRLTEEEEEQDVSGSQAAAREASTLEAVRLYIYSKPALCRQILLYQPIELAGLQAELKQNGIRIALGKLLDFLDAHCVTFTTAEARREKLLRRPKKRGRRRY